MTLDATLGTVRSADGTTIAYDRLGSGPPVIAIAGASCDRARMRPTAERLAQDLTVLNYDRRGRGASGDTLPYAVEREIEDIAALIEAAGGRASLYGHSSGAGLALLAAAAGLPVDRLILHDAPYSPARDDEAHREARTYGTELRELLAAGRQGDAMAHFMTLVGMPDEMVAAARNAPSWPALEALAPTLAYDSAVMGDVERGGTLPVETARRVTAETLVLCGGESPPFMMDVARELVAAVPNARLRVLDGQDHTVPPDVLGPVVAEFLAR